MPPTPDLDACEALRDLLSDGAALVLTGAGVSTDSGIPDYRGPTGRRRHAAPMTYQQFVSSADDRRRYWARGHLGWPRVANAAPNVAHRTVAAWQMAGRLSGVVTQNVDGLHARAGARGVVDLHGRLDTVVCLGCGQQRPRLEVALRLDAVNPGFRAAHEDATGGMRPDGDVVLSPAQEAAFRTVDCRRCGGMLKPNVVFFGEQVPRDRFRRSLALLDASRSLVVLGSSLTVGSGYRFVTAAVRRGLPVAIVNRGTTRGDRHATVRIDAGLADVLPLAAGERRLAVRT